MENIVDHTNVGALMRSAAALDVDAVLVTPSCGDRLYRRAARVSMGTVFQVPWTRIGGDDKHYWPFTGMRELHDLGFTTVAMALEDDSISLAELVRRLNNTETESDHIDKLALIFGTEGDGLSHHTISRADLTVKIPFGRFGDEQSLAGLQVRIKQKKGISHSFRAYQEPHITHIGPIATRQDLHHGFQLL